VGSGKGGGGRLFTTPRTKNRKVTRNNNRKKQEDTATHRRILEAATRLEKLWGRKKIGEALSPSLCIKSLGPQAKKALVQKPAKN
jgi:hypothetical protein